MPRAAFEALFSTSGATHLYVVARAHDEVRTPAGGACFVQPSLLKMKLAEGARHPFVRALLGSDASVARVFDATLGLGVDAMHAACALGCEVQGTEVSAVLFSLLEEGLARLARATPAVARVRPMNAEAGASLAALPNDAVDVVMLDPMMSRPKRSTPSFAVLRDFAKAERADAALLREAARVARRRVVLKLGKGAPLPQDAPIAFARVERGSSVCYWVHDKA
ncbi:MAG: class I SAM-dependent methyltransferase [Deltaproteobacteria bacterium]|nr:class I SAM-dependent methyltransferase [Deltaproteobacteria bacterium]